MKKRFKLILSGMQDRTVDLEQLYSASLIFKNEYEKLWKSCFKVACYTTMSATYWSLHPSAYLSTHHQDICPAFVQQSVPLSHLLILGEFQVAAPVKNPD